MVIALQIALMLKRGCWKVGGRLILLIGLGHFATIGHARSNSEYFDLSLEQLLDVEIKVASLTETTRAIQPASVTVIDQYDIKTSSARTLNDLLMLYVPGYFKAEDKDDTIAAFRGIAPDNNSKVMLLVDGVRVNANWFWGPADAILNGHDLSYIKRIEVIRGPGSVTLGQGAQLGVISIETFAGDRRAEDRQQIDISVGSLQRYGVGYHVSTTKEGHRLGWHLSATGLEGESIPNKGWGAEVFESDSSHPGPAASRGNRLHRSDANHMLINYGYDVLSAQLQYHNQVRDLYNWTKDRDQVEQRLFVLQLGVKDELTERLGYELSFSWQQDDYALFDLTTGLTTGGAREERFMLKPQLSYLFENEISWVIGLDFEGYETGEKNWLGDNFIINRTEFLNADRNSLNTWVFSDKFSTGAVFSELSGSLTDQFNFNVGFRYDDHPQWGRQQTTRASVFYGFTSEQVLRLTYQEGFRGAPGVHYSGGFLRDGLLSEENFDQLEGSGMTDRDGNPLMNLSTVAPETLEVIELGFNGLISKSVHVDVVTYVQRVNDILFTESTRQGIPESNIGSDLVGTWGGVFYYANASEPLDMWGVETSLSWKQKHLSHRLLLSHSGILESNDFSFGGKSPVAGSESNPHTNGMPEQMLKYHLDWKVNDVFEVYYRHQYYVDWWAPPTNQKVKGFHLASAGLGWSVSDRQSVALNIGNVWGETALYPMRATASLSTDPGTPTIPSTFLDITYRVQF